MIEAVNEKYCQDNLVQLMFEKDLSQLIVSTEEIMLLKIGDKVLVNKYTNHPDREKFPYHEKEVNDECYNELCEYNKLYLNYRGFKGFSFHKNYFFKGNSRALWFNQTLDVDDRTAREDSVELSREEIENIFDSKNYDAMYVMDKDGRISLVRNKKDKIKIGKNIIPTDDEIVKMEYRIENITFKLLEQ